MEDGHEVMEDGHEVMEEMLQQAWAIRWWGGRMDRSLCCKKLVTGTGDGSVVKSTDCSSRGPESNSQQPHGGSQPSVMRSDALFWCV